MGPGPEVSGAPRGLVLPLARSLVFRPLVLLLGLTSESRTVTPAPEPTPGVEGGRVGREDEQRQSEKQTDHPNSSVNSLQSVESHRILKLTW